MGKGARSITGLYLAILGANGAIVGFVSGFEELAGYVLRLVSGYLAEHLCDNQCPTLILVGKEDWVTDSTYSKEMAALISAYFQKC